MTPQLLRKFGQLVYEIGNKFYYVVFGGIAVDGYIGKVARSHLDVDMIIFREGLEKAEKARDTTPSAMESASDTTRNENEKLVFALNNELKKLNNIISTIPTKTSKQDKQLGVKEWNPVKISIEDDLMTICLVPEGAGGGVIDSVRLISSSSSLGKAIINKKLKDNFFFNDKKGVVINI